MGVGFRKQGFFFTDDQKSWLEMSCKMVEAASLLGGRTYRGPVWLRAETCPTVRRKPGDYAAQVSYMHYYQICMAAIMYANLSLRHTDWRHISMTHVCVCACTQTHSHIGFVILIYIAFTGDES